LVCFDRFGQVRDFYFPYVGLEDHIGHDYVHKIGVWVDGSISWLSDSGWGIKIDYQKETMASSIFASHGGLGVELQFIDVVYNEKNILLRRVTVFNKSDRKRFIRVFFNQQFQISETTHADTAYFNPTLDVVVHYKGRRVFLIGGIKEGKNSFDDYSTGLFREEGKEGTWKDAEDGSLSKNPIEHGSVDSTVGFDLEIPAAESKSLTYWVAVGETLDDVRAIHEYILAKTPDHLFETTKNFWNAWVNKFSFSFYGLDPKVIELFKKSLLIIRTHVDNNGAILASGDSDHFQYGRDTYGYMWPRDGAFTALALDKAGYFNTSHNFYSFCNQVITREGYLLHKYQPDKSLGSSWHPWIKKGKKQLAIQEDETSTLLFTLWQHYLIARDLEFIESIYNSFIKRAADFLVSYRDKETGLTGPSYDLWEEKYGISTFTAASVYGGLIAASNFAEVLGKEDEKHIYLEAAEEIKKAILATLNCENYFCKLLVVGDGKRSHDITVDSSSFYGMFRFGLLLPNDPLLVNAYNIIKDNLSKTIPVGGVARYEGDHYFFSGGNAPGNPWFVASAWLLQYEIAKATDAEEMKKIAEKLLWFSDHALPSGIFSEQLNPYSGEQLSVSPLTWSHGEFVTTVIEYLQKLELLGICKACYPVKQY